MCYTLYLIQGLTLSVTRLVEIHFWLIRFLFPLATLANKLNELFSVFLKEDISEFPYLASKKRSCLVTYTMLPLPTITGVIDRSPSLK